MQGCPALCHRLRHLGLQHQPQDAVIKPIIHAIGRADIQPLRHSSGRGMRGILFIQILIREDWVIRGQVGYAKDSTAASSSLKISNRLRTPTSFKVCVANLLGCTSLMLPPSCLVLARNFTSKPIPLESMLETPARFRTMRVSPLRIDSRSEERR